ncbi:hypothetical protein [Hufsiella ginkgonis]|uniref:Uncharacterized protein n=1 Tax=Hufsiella ginkgonis TaxID=2695274 RepID=A0A7K1XU51_9SPHI|nr:hypothetical protein [Hufsiella ginkgonis]MXV14327.1 hypothetical protein [Hufsiella ginkgonis]
MRVKEEDSPIIKAVNQVYHGTTIADLEADYFHQYGHIDRWTLFSDYSFASGKLNDVVTFSFLPFIQNPFELGSMINLLAPGEIKQTRSVSPAFASFLRHLPFLSFSFVISNHKYGFYNNYQNYKASLLLSLDNLYNSIPGWNEQDPFQKETNIAIGRKIKKIRNYIEQDKKHRVLRNLILITTIGGFLATLVANRTQCTKMGWFSDRDEINDMEKNFSLDLFNITFIQYLYDKYLCKFLAAPADSKSDEFYADLIKIPDYLTGALADYNQTSQTASHSKFSTLIDDVIANNRRNIFIYNMDFHNGQYFPTCSRLMFNR